MPIIFIEQTAASVPTPAAGKLTVFVDVATGLLRMKDDTGAVIDFSAAGVDHGALTGLADDDHPQYETSVEVDAKVTTHAAAADPHTGYQKESEKGQASGYASLGVDSLVPQDQLGTGVQDGTKVLRDDGVWVAQSGGVTDHGALAGLADDDHPQYETSAEAAAKVTAHEAAADPHAGYQKESEKGAVSGYASLDAGGTVPDAQIPAAIARDSELHSETHSDTQHSDGPNAKTNLSFITASSEASLSAEKVLGTDIIMSGTEAARPAASLNGRFYFATDTLRLFRDTGSAWTTVSVQKLAELNERAHGSLTGVGANDHHNQAHSISGADHTGTLAHSALSSVTANQHHNEVHNATKHTAVGASVTKTTAQTLATNTWTVVAWNSEVFDTDNLHNNVTNNSRITIPAGMGGLWLAGYSVPFYQLDGRRMAEIRKNGAGTYARIDTQVALNKDITFGHSAAFQVLAGDYLECWAFQASGFSIDLYWDGAIFWATYLGT